MPEPTRPEPKHHKIRDTKKARAAAKKSAKARKKAKPKPPPKKKKKLRLCSVGEMATIKAYLDPSVAHKSKAIKIGYPNRKYGIAEYAKDVFARPPVKAEIARQREMIQNDVRQKATLTAPMIIEQCRRLAFADVTDVLQYQKGKDQWGRPVYSMKMTDFDALTPEIKSAIKDIKVKTIQRKGKDELLIQEIEIKMYDKQSALRDLGKQFNLFVETIDVNHSNTVGHVHTSMAEMRTMFETMTQDDREAWIAKRMEAKRGTNE